MHTANRPLARLSDEQLEQLFKSLKSKVERINNGPLNDEDCQRIARLAPRTAVALMEVSEEILMR